MSKTRNCPHRDACHSWSLGMRSGDRRWPAVLRFRQAESHGNVPDVSLAGVLGSHHIPQGCRQSGGNRYQSHDLPETRPSHAERLRAEQSTFHLLRALANLGITDGSSPLVVYDQVAEAVGAFASGQGGEPDEPALT